MVGLLLAADLLRAGDLHRPHPALPRLSVEPPLPLGEVSGRAAVDGPPAPGPWAARADGSDPSTARGAAGGQAGEAGVALTEVPHRTRRALRGPGGAEGGAEIHQRLVEVVGVARQQACGQPPEDAVGPA